jgi:hypothetical protein
VGCRRGFGFKTTEGVAQRYLARPELAEWSEPKEIALHNVYPQISQMAQIKMFARLIFQCVSHGHDCKPPEVILPDKTGIAALTPNLKHGPAVLKWNPPSRSVAYRLAGSSVSSMF